MRQQQEQREQPSDERQRESRGAGAHLPPCGRRTALRRPAPFAPAFEEARDEQPGDRQGDEEEGLDFGDIDVAVLARGEDLRRHDAERAAEDVGRRERAERGQEGEDRRRRERRCKTGQDDPGERAQTPGTERRRGFELRAVEARQGGAGEEIEVDVHRVGVDEEDRPRPGEAPGSALDPQEVADEARRHTALAVKVEESDHPDERRQRHRQRQELPQHPPAGKLGAGEEEAERHADKTGETYRGERDPQAAKERRPLVRPVHELRKRRARGGRGGCASGAGFRDECRERRDDERISHQPGEQQEHARTDPPATGDGTHVESSAAEADGKSIGRLSARRRRPTRAPGGGISPVTITSTSIPESTRTVR